MKKIKQISYGMLSLAILAPSFVAAQFDPNAGGGTNLSNASITTIIKSLMNWLLMMVGIVGVIGFVISGIMYLTAAGDSGVIDRAKKAMTYSIIGVLVALIGLVVIGAVNSLLKGNGSI